MQMINQRANQVSLNKFQNYVKLYQTFQETKKEFCGTVLLFVSRYATSTTIVNTMPMNFTWTCISK